METTSDGNFGFQQKELQKINAMKCIKTSFKSILNQNLLTTIKIDDVVCEIDKNILQNFNQILEDIVYRVNVIKFHTYKIICSLRI